MVSTFNSQKFTFWSFASMFLLVFVHGYNLNISYLQPFTTPQEPLTINSFFQYFLANGIFRFRIPMLFIISGYLFAMGDAKPYWQRIKSRTKTVLAPYLIWSAFGLLLTFILEMFPYSKSIVEGSGMMWVDEKRQLLHLFTIGEVIERWIFNPASYQLWFLRVLFFYNLLYPVLKWLVTHQIAKLIFFPFCVLLWMTTANLFFFEGEGLLFFSLGIWMQKNNFNIDSPPKWLNPKIWVVIFITMATIKTLIAFSTLNLNYFIVLSLLHKITIFSGLISAWYGCNALVKFFMNLVYFKRLTSYSFMIYVFHAPLVVYGIAFVAKEFGWYQHYRIFGFILLPLFLIVLSIAFGYLLKMISPKFYSFVTGGRGIK